MAMTAVDVGQTCPPLTDGAVSFPAASVVVAALLLPAEPAGRRGPGYSMLAPWSVRLPGRTLKEMEG